MLPIDKAPEVFTFNVQWDRQQPKAINILKMFVSMPEVFNLRALYKHEDQGFVGYTLKGLVCREGTSGHQVAIFRRIFHKLSFL